MKYMRFVCALIALVAASMFGSGSRVGYAQVDDWCTCKGASGDYDGQVYGYRNNPYYEFVWQYGYHAEVPIDAIGGYTGAAQCADYCAFVAGINGDDLCEDFGLTSLDWFEKDYVWSYVDTDNSEGGSGGAWVFSPGLKYYCP